MATTIIDKTILPAIAIASLFPLAAIAQSRDIPSGNMQPNGIYTYHGGVIAAPPQEELTPLVSQSVTTFEITVQHATPSIAYPEGNIAEPVALDAENATIPVSSHEATLTTTKKLYDNNGNLLKTTQIDHAKDN